MLYIIVNKDGELLLKRVRSLRAMNIDFKWRRRLLVVETIISVSFSTLLKFKLISPVIFAWSLIPVTILFFAATVTGNETKPIFKIISCVLWLVIVVYSMMFFLNQWYMD